MNTYTFLIFAVTLAACNSIAIRGSSVQSAQQDERLNDHRHLLQESTCTLYQKCITYEPTEEHPNGYHEHTWSCRLSESDSKTLDVDYLDIVNSTAVGAIQNAKSGKSVMTTNEAIVDTKTQQMYVPDDAHVEVRDISGDERRLHDDEDKVATTGTLRTLMIRITDKNNNGPKSNATQLYEKLFEDEICLKSQMNACSYGKLQIEPFQANNVNGVVDVKVEQLASDEDGFAAAARSAANELLGNTNDPRFGLVMYCFPPGTKGLAWAYSNNKHSFYVDEWCGAVGANIHEIGHNLNMGHSGDIEQEVYGDGTGLMGTNVGKDPVRMCYNAQKSFQVGWYADKTDTINPLDGTGSYEFILNGVSDYGRKTTTGAEVSTKRPTSRPSTIKPSGTKRPTTKPTMKPTMKPTTTSTVKATSRKLNSSVAQPPVLVVLRLEEPSTEMDYYITYNRATGINEDVLEDKDKLTIILKEKGGPQDYSQSLKVASLIPGQRHVIENFDNKKNIQVVFTGIENGDARVLVHDHDLELTTMPVYDECKKFTVEVKTDKKPEETSWYITDTLNGGQAVAVSQPYSEKKTYRQDICLPMGEIPSTYQFTILDNGANGLCCNKGRGSYKIYDEHDQIIISGAEFDIRENRLIVVDNPSLSPSSAPSLIASQNPTGQPSASSSISPSSSTSSIPSAAPSLDPSAIPSDMPPIVPSSAPIGTRNRKLRGSVA